MRLRRFRERVPSAYVGTHTAGAHDVEQGGHTLGRELCEHRPQRRLVDQAAAADAWRRVLDWSTAHVG